MPPPGREHYFTGKYYSLVAKYSLPGNRRYEASYQASSCLKVARRLGDTSASSGELARITIPAIPDAVLATLGKVKSAMLSWPLDSPEPRRIGPEPLRASYVRGSTSPTLPHGKCRTGLRNDGPFLYRDTRRTSWLVTGGETYLGRRKHRIDWTTDDPRLSLCTMHSAPTRSWAHAQP